MNKSPFDPPPPHHGKSAPTPQGGLRLAPFWKRSMDDATRDGAGEPFDALADLFLGEIGPPEGGARKGAQAVAPVTDEDAPRLRLAGAEERGQEYPVEPVVPRAASQEAISTRAAAPVLKMAAEEDGEAKAVRVILPPPVRNPVMECVVLANLPVVGAAWAGQYAREVASAAGKMVACLRVEGDFVRLELVGAAPEGVELPTGDFATIETAIDAAAEITDRWIVRCDAGQEGVVAACGMTRAISVLSGVDPMAREACRPVFERLAGALGEKTDEAGPMLRLALMGAGEDGAGAKEIGEGLAQMAEQTIGRGVTPVVCSARIGSGKSPHLLFGGTSDLGLKSMLALVERAVAPEGVTSAPMFAAPARVETMREEMRSAVEADVETIEPVAPEVIAPVAPPLPRPVPNFPTPSRPEPIRVPEPVRMPDTRRVASVEAGSNITGGRAARATRRPPLASHLAELKPLAFSCPYAEGIELAIDGSGSIHLLANGVGGEEEAVRSLMVASSWAEAHAAILAATGTGVRESARPTMHLFTDEPKRMRRMLDTPVRVHLLAPVSVGGRVGWYCAELN